MNSKSYRLREFISPADGHSLVVDASAGLSLGALPGLEQFAEAVKPILALADAVVASPGQASKLAGRSRTEAALLVRGDWSNASRKPDFVLPPEVINHIHLLDPAEALDLGASALVINFLLGYEEQIEAGCLKNTVQMALKGGQIGLPLIVDVQPSGPRVVLPSKAVELGISYALEGGADGAAIPWPGPASLQNILTMMAGLPVWIKPTSIESAGIDVTAALSQGATGLWLDERLFASDNPAATLDALRVRLHSVPALE